jgi:hypothetical protein
VLALASVSALACGQEHPKPEEQAPAVAAQPVTAPAADPASEPAPAAEPAKPEPAPTSAPAKPGPSADAPAVTNPTANAVCTQVCDRTEKLHCGPLEACMAACAAASDGSVCPAEMSKLMSCALKQPAEHWECSDEGVAAIRDGYCDKEQEAFMSCAMKAG